MPFELATLGADVSDFLTGTKAPWWSAYAGIIVGGVIAFATSVVIERRRAAHGREARDEDRKESARKEAVELVAQFDTHVETLRQRYVAQQHRWSREFPDHVDEGGSNEHWDDEVHDRYAEIRLAGSDEFLAAWSSFSAIQMLPTTDLTAAANDVMAAVGELRPRNNEATHAAVLEALALARHVLLAVAKNLFQSDILGVADRDTLYHRVKNDIQEQRLVIGDPPGITEVRTPVHTNATLLNLTQGEALQHGRAAQFVAQHFLDQGMSAAVLIFELADKSVDYYAIGLPTEGKPVTNVPGWEDHVAGLAGDDFEGHILSTPPGTVTNFFIDESGDIIRTENKWVDGSPIGVSPPTVINAYRSWKRRRPIVAIRRRLRPFKKQTDEDQAD